MESSNLQSLVLELLEPLKSNPGSLIESLLPPDKLKLWYAIRGIGASFKFNPDQLILGLIEKLSALPTETWIQIEDTLIGVCDGDPDAIQTVKQLLGGVVVDANEN